MKLDQFVALLVRLFCIHLFVTVILRSIWALASYSYNRFPSNQEMFFAYLAIIVSMFIIIFVLWNYSLFIAKKIIPNVSKEKLNIPVSFIELQTLCFSVLGVWIGVEGIVKLGHHIINLGFFESLGADSNFDGWPEIIRIVIGIFLIVGAEGLSKTIRILRKKP